MKGDQIRKNYNRLKQDRSTLDGTLDLIGRFIMPLRSEFYDTISGEHSVDWRSRDDYDSTASESVDTLASSIQGALTSMAMQWFELRMRNKELNNDIEVQRWLEACAEIMYQELQESNFDTEVSEFYLDLCGYGNAIIIEEATEDLANWDGLNFKAVPLDSSYFEEDHKGNIMNFYRCMSWTANQIYSKFGDSTPQEIKDKVGESSEKFDVIFCIYFRKDKKDADTSKKLSAKERPYGYKYVLAKCGTELGEGGYYEMPAFVSRWRRTPGSVWGYGPSHLALSDVLTLNELTADLLESLGKAIDPSTLTTQRNLLSDLDLGRGGLTVVRDVNDIVPFETRARFDVGELKIDRLQEAIRRTYRVDQLQLKDSPAMTATEAEIRYELMQRLLGPTLGRLKNDFLDPMLKRTFNLLFRAGKLPEIPQVVIDSQSEMDIEYTGPLPRSQKTQRLHAVQQWVMSVAQLAEIKPEVMDIPDFDRIVHESAKLAGVPAMLVNDEKTISKTRKVRAQQEAQMAQMQQLKEGMAAAKDGSVAMKNAMEAENGQ